MKKCFGCRQNLPLGSGRYHYFRNQTIPCTHHPATGQPYDSDELIEAFNKVYGKNKDEKYYIEIPKCECGGDKLNLTHSSWCQKSTT